MEWRLYRDLSPFVLAWYFTKEPKNKHRLLLFKDIYLDTHTETTTADIYLEQRELKIKNRLVITAKNKFEQQRIILFLQTCFTFIFYEYTQRTTSRIVMKFDTYLSATASQLIRS